MSNETVAKDTEFDFDFDVEELMQGRDEPSAATAQDDPELSQPKASTPNAQSSSNDSVLENFESAPEPAKKKGMGALLIVGIVVVMVALLGVLGVLAFSLLKPATSQQAQAAFPSTSTDSGFSGSSAGEGSNQFGVVSGVDSTQAWGGETNAESVTPVWGSEVNTTAYPDSASIDMGRPPIIIHPGADQTGEAVDALGVEQPITDEERVYDELLAKASQLEVLPEAIVIDQNVVRRQVDNMRVQELETQIVTTRESLGQLRTTIDGMQSTVGALASQIESSTERQVALVQSVETLSATVDSLSKSRESDLRSLNDAIKGLTARTDEVQKGIQAVRNEARQAPARPVAAAQAPAQARAAAPAPTPAPAPAPVPQRPVVAAPAPSPAPAAQPASSAAVQTAALTPQGQQPRMVQAAAPAAPVAQQPATAQANQCASTAVSANWRVKGVNSTSAYIARPQDRTGLFVREGIEVPGFGTVVSFDPNTRSVCTTAGLIQR